MSEYKRFISYMYRYDHGVKKENAGYVRVERRDGRCKITTHLNIGGILGSEHTVYCFLRKGDNLEGVEIGTVSLTQGTGRGQYTGPEDNIGGSHKDFSCFGGIIVFLSKDLYYGTEWDDRPLCFQSLFTEEKSWQEESRQTAQEAAEEKILLENAELEAASMGAGLAGKLIDGEQQENESEEELMEEAEKKQGCEKEGICRCPLREETKMDNKVIPMPERSRKLVFVPATLPELKEKIPHLIINDFMIQGFRRFGHLVYSQSGEKIWLGVPGIFCQRERRYSDIYGYTNFVPKDDKRLEYGDYGYWYRSDPY